MEFKNHSSFRIKHKVDKQEISLLFQRIGIDWKITQIELPEDLLNEFKKTNLNPKSIIDLIYSLYEKLFCLSQEMC